MDERRIQNTNVESYFDSLPDFPFQCNYLKLNLCVCVGGGGRVS